MDLLVLSVVAGRVVAVGLWLATRDSPTAPESIITHITPVSGNIFTDLGFEPDEAEKLLAEADGVVPPTKRS